MSQTQAQRKISRTEQQTRKVLKRAVNVFGFAGVLSLLGQEAERRLGYDDESAEQIVDAIHYARGKVVEKPSDEQALKAINEARAEITDFEERGIDT